MRVLASSRVVVAAIVAVPWFLCSGTLSRSRALADPVHAPVVGGREVEPGEWPDVVAVLLEGDGLCTGTLLGADIVLTAAHCVEAGPREVIVGAVDLAHPDGQRRAVKWARAYPNWAERYDVGVIMLEHPVLAPQRAIARGCTPLHRPAQGTSVEVVGFGLTTATATDRNTRLHAATLEVVDPTCTSDPSCEPAIAPFGELTAGGGGRDACFGDSGGPLYIATASGPALLGVVSRGLVGPGLPCGGGGVFVRADKLVAWIQTVTDRVIDRVPCDAPPDAGGRTSADESGSAGCAAAGAGLLHGGFVLVYALTCIRALRAARARRARNPPSRGRKRRLGGFTSTTS